MKHKCFPNDQTSCGFGEESELQTKSFGGGCGNQRTNSYLNVYLPNCSKQVDVALNAPPTLPLYYPESHDSSED